MKLDSEDQRIQLIQLLEAITIQVPMGQAGTVEAQVNAILDPIRNAQIEKVSTPRKRKAGK